MTLVNKKSLRLTMSRSSRYATCRNWVTKTSFNRCHVIWVPWTRCSDTCFVISALWKLYTVLKRLFRRSYPHCKHFIFTFSFRWWKLKTTSLNYTIMHWNVVWMCSMRSLALTAKTILKRELKMSLVKMFWFFNIMTPSITVTPCSWRCRPLFCFVLSLLQWQIMEPVVPVLTGPLRYDSI